MRGFLANRVPRIRQTRCHLSRSLVAESGEARGTYRVVTDHYSRYGSWPPRVHIRSAVVFSCIHTELAPPVERTHTQTPARTPLSRPGGCGWEVSFFCCGGVGSSSTSRGHRKLETMGSESWRWGDVSAAALRADTSRLYVVCVLRLWFRDWALQHQPDPRRIVTRNEATTNRSAAGQHNGLPFMAD